MPVIAFNASAKVAEWYNDIKKGKRSKILNGRLEQALRLEENYQESGSQSYAQMELEIQSLKDSIQKFQARLFVKEIEVQVSSRSERLLKWIMRRKL